MSTEPTLPYVAQRSEPPEDGSQALPLGFRLDEFEIQAKLGEGGFGIVYRAWDHSLGQVRAIKEYMPAGIAQRDPGGSPQVLARSSKLRETFDKGLQRFIEEAQTLARFDHPSLVRVLRRWEAHGTAYMAMPLYEGATLREHIRALPERPGEDWLMQLLDPLTEALAVVHGHHWLHRDIAPDNIMLLKGSGRPLLLDFGAARQVIGDQTQELTAILKPGFAPIEQYGETPGLEQGPWTDVYALAATLHWVLLGRAPAASVSRVLVDNQKPLVESAHGLAGERLLAALDKALRVDARQRTQSMAELRADLGLAPAAAPGAATPSRTETVTKTVAATAAATDELTQLLTRPAQDPAAWARTEMAATQQIDPGTLDLTPTAAPTAAPTPRTPSPAPEEDLPATTTQAPAAPVVQMLAQPASRAPRAAPNAPTTPALQNVNAAGSSGKLLGLGGGILLLLALGLGAYALRGPSESAAPQQTGSAAPAAATATPTTGATSPTAAAALRFDLDEQLQRLMAGGRASLVPTLTDAPAQISVQSQQMLSFQIEPREDAYLTVLVRGPDGSLTRLLADQPPLKLKAGQRFAFPPAGSDRLQAAEPLGAEDVFVLLSRLPRQYRELAGERAGSFETLPTGDAASALLRQWRGETPWLAGRVEGPCPGGSGCDDYGVARLRVEVVR
jgi:serine/threonine protein kinase